MTEIEVEILKSARRLISNPKGWCKGASSRQKNGDVAFFDDHERTSYSLVGAISHSCPCDDNELYKRVLELFQYPMNAYDARIYLNKFNDNSTHEQVLLYLDNTIAMTEAMAKAINSIQTIYRNKNLRHIKCKVLVEESYD